jgi:hypothetical protein
MIVFLFINLESLPASSSRSLARRELGASIRVMQRVNRVLSAAAAAASVGVAAFAVSSSTASSSSSPTSSSSKESATNAWSWKPSTSVGVAHCASAYTLHKQSDYYQELDGALAQVRVCFTFASSSKYRFTTPQLPSSLTQLTRSHPQLTHTALLLLLLNCYS